MTKQYAAGVICFIISVVLIYFIYTNRFKNRAEKSVLSNRELLDLPVEFGCLDSEHEIDTEKKFAIGAFFHHTHKYSVRTQKWEVLRIQGKKEFAKSVALSIVPYIQEIGKEMKYLLILTQGQKGLSYELVCTDNAMNGIKKFPHNYPTVMLTPQEGYQDKLKKFLSTANEHEILASPIKDIPLSTINNLNEMVKHIFNRKQAYFLQEWTEGTVLVSYDPLNEYNFTYHPDVRFTISRSDNLPFSYRIGEQEIRPGKTTSFVIPYSEVNKQTRIEVKTHSDCSTSHRFTLEEASQKDPLYIPHRCKKNIIIWPYGFVSPQLSDDSCLSYEKNNNRLECVRLKTDPVKISWRGGWKETIIEASKLNSKKEIFIGPDVSFTVAIPEDTPFSYRYGNKELEPGKVITISLPYYSLGKSIKFTNSKYPECNFSKKFWFSEAISKKLITLKSPCKKNSIQLPEGSATNISQNGCLNKDLKITGNKIECIRLKAKNLTIKGNGWEKTITNDRLNKNSEYKLEPDVSFTDDEIRVSGEERPDSCGKNLPIEVYTEDIPYGYNTLFILFQNEQDCEDINAQRQKKFLYQLSTLESVTSNECEWARVVKGREGVSLCAKGERREGKIYFDMLPD